jgi:hypothetical protein
LPRKAQCSDWVFIKISTIGCNKKPCQPVIIARLLINRYHGLRVQTPEEMLIRRRAPMPDPAAAPGSNQGCSETANRTAGHRRARRGDGDVRPNNDKSTSLQGNGLPGKFRYPSGTALITTSSCRLQSAQGMTVPTNGGPQHHVDWLGLQHPWSVAPTASYAPFSVDSAKASGPSHKNQAFRCHVAAACALPRVGNWM